MPHYKDDLNNVYWLDSSDDDYLLPGDAVVISDDEAAVLTKALQDSYAELTPEQVLQAANAKRDELLSVAGLRVAPLQDAVDIGKAGHDDERLLQLWKQYRVDVSRVDRQAGFPDLIDWPKEPS